MICAVSLTAHWAFMFWQQSLIRSLPEVKSLTGPQQTNAVVVALMYIMIGSIIGNYVAGGMAKLTGLHLRAQNVREITIANDGIVNQKTVMAYAANSFAMIEELDRIGRL